MQKRLLVELVRRYAPTTITLAIGDGANDVPMIQGAHVGIGRSNPSPGTVRIIENIKIVQKSCPEWVWGPRLHNKGEKDVRGLRPPTFFSLLWRNLSPQTPSGHDFCAIIMFRIIRIVPGDGLLQGIGIRGKEGAQAVQASDVAISQFRFLVPLMFCHGSRAYRRISLYLCYYLYKSVALVIGDVIWAHMDQF